MSKLNVVLRAPFNYDADAVSDATGFKFDPEEGRTQQEFAKECDINEIVRRFGLTGQMPEVVHMPLSGDFTGVTDFQSAMNLVTQAQAEFMAIPAELRMRFNNDPSRLIAFLEDGKNKDEAVKLGLVELPPEKTRDVVQAVDELAAKMAGGTPKP